LKRGGPGGHNHGMQAKRIMVCLAAAVAGACASEAEIEVSYYIPPGQEDPCGPNGCGGNSPVVGGVYFWSLHLGGATNQEGVRITSVHKNGVSMKLQLVDGDRLRGVHPVTGALIVEDTSLPGTRIKLSVNSMPYEIVIEAAAPSTSFWVMAPLPIWEYRFKYRPLFGDDQRLRPLCSRGADPTLLDAIVFGGDSYDPVTKAITTGAVTHDWANIACAKSALYKMHRIGYTTAAEKRLGFKTEVKQRRAMLNAWTSNVCGTGEAFTHQDEAITLSESTGKFNVFPYNAVPVSREAIWDEGGAVCLDTHRLDEDDPEIYEKLTVACGGALPKSCDELIGPWTAHGHVRTGNL
jgi:hypothetical protein